MTKYVIKEIDIDVTSFLKERSEFTEFGKLVFEHLRVISKSLILVPEDFTFKNQPFTQGFSFPSGGSIDKLNEYLRSNGDVTMLISDDFSFTKSAPFLERERNHYNFYKNEIVWAENTPMDEDTLSWVLNGSPVHSLTLGVRHHKVEPQKYELQECEIISYINDTKFVICSIFDEESFLILELV